VPPGLIIFDCDGVLVDSETLAGRNVSECLRALGIEVSASEVISRYTGISDKMMCEDLRRQFGQLIPQDFAEMLRLTVSERFEADLQPIPGIERVLREIPYRICVASSSPSERIKHSLTVTGLIRYFDTENTFSSVQVSRGKPAPDLFLFAAASMSVPAAECAVIEDSIPGVVAAVAAGMRCIGFAGGGHCDPEHAEKLLKAGALSLLTEMRALPRALLGLVGPV
jgi:HAD superfamily hydrolase (TIGR01509 family)